MIVLDTNVISEVVKPTPSPAVISWLNVQHSADIHVTSVTLGEINYGVASLPAGRRRTDLAAAIEEFMHQAFGDRILDYDADSARHYGEIMATRRRIGRPLTAPDGQIAAIARHHGFRLATRNITDFDDCGIGLVNPFEHGTE